jgi:hypothetical protein
MEAEEQPMGSLYISSWGLEKNNALVCNDICVNV